MNQAGASRRLVNCLSNVFGGESVSSRSEYAEYVPYALAVQTFFEAVHSHRFDVIQTDVAMQHIPGQLTRQSQERPSDARWHDEDA